MLGTGAAIWATEAVTGSRSGFDWSALGPVLLGGGILFLCGIWDDLRGLPAWTKFLCQSLAAATVIAQGILIVRVSFGGSITVDLGLLAYPLTFLWLVGVTNAFNLIDGLDGLAAGLAGIAAGTCAAIFLLRGDVQDAMLLVILLGALLGFLRYNFNPARIFLGDSGSLVVGYLLAVTAITGSQKGATALAAVVPLLVFGLPILDTLLSMARRFVGGLRVMQPYKAPLKQLVLAAKRMFEADQAHIHHRLLAIGFSHRNAVLVMYTVALGLSAMALLSVLAQFRNAGIILIAVGLSTYIGIRKLGYHELTFLKTGMLLRWCDKVTFNRLFFLGFFDLALITAAYWLSFVLKYDFHWSPGVTNWYQSTFPLVVLIQLAAFWVFDLYRGVWRTTGLGDLLQVHAAVASGVALSYAVVLVSVPPDGVLAFFCIDLLVLAALAGGARCTYRIFNYMARSKQSVNSGALIYGAGCGGQLVLRELLLNVNRGIRPVGFIDDDPRLHRRAIDQVPVLGSVADLVSIVDRHRISSVIISSDKIRPDRLREVLALCAVRQISVFQAHLTLKPIGSNDAGGIGVMAGTNGEPACCMSVDQSGTPAEQQERAVAASRRLEREKGPKTS